MRLTFLGTGTSVGVPIIGCDCAVCTSTDSRNKRRRSSVHVEAAGQHIVVDTTPDFRDQALTFKVPRVDAVLFTHSHADHIFGFDDIRRYNTMQDCVIPAYGLEDTIADLERIFDYVHQEKVQGMYRPRIVFNVLTGPVQFGELRVTPVPVTHDPKPTCGFLFESQGKRLAYVPDCKGIDDEWVETLAGLDVMILDALRHHEHRTHFTVEQSLEMLKRIDAKQSYITHMTHDLDHDATQAILPERVAVSYDGLVVEI